MTSGQVMFPAPCTFRIFPILAIGMAPFRKLFIK